MRGRQQRTRSAEPVCRVEELLKAALDAAVTNKAIGPNEFERLIVDTTVQEKAIAHPVDSRQLEIARAKVVQAAKQAGIEFKQTFAKEGKELRRKAGGYAHAKQFKRLRRVEAATDDPRHRPARDQTQADDHLRRIGHRPHPPDDPDGTC